MQPDNLVARFDRACALYTGVVNILYQWRPQAYGYIAVENAPDTDVSISAAIEFSKQTGEPYPVYKGGSEDTVFLSAEDNYKFRFLHDHDHARLRFALTIADERKLGHYWAARVFHLSRDKDVALIAELDTVGQTDHLAMWGKFPDNQRAFVFEQFKERLCSSPTTL